MATKKKAAPKVRRPRIAVNPDPQIIQIDVDGSVPDSIHLSASGKKLPNKVYWVPLDDTKTWVITFDPVPDPFSNGSASSSGPIETTAANGTRTRKLNVDPNLGGTGPYDYDVSWYIAGRRRGTRVSGGGIIIDA